MTPSGCFRASLLAATILIFAAANCPAKHPWQKYEYHGCVLLSDAPEKDAKEMLVGYSAFRVVYASILPRSQTRTPPPCLTVFRDESELGHCWANSHEYRIALGFDLDGSNRVAVALINDVPTSLRHLYSEAASDAIAQAHLPLPGWLAFGAADVFESVEYDAKSAKIGHEASNLYLQGAGSDVFHPDRPVSLAWRVMFPILLSAPTGAEDRIRALSAGLPGAKSAGDAALPILHWDRAKLYAAVSYPWDQTIAFPFDANAVRSGITVSPASEFEVALRLAELKLGAGNKTGADADLKRAQALAPHDPALLEALARQQLDAGNNERALALYRQAIAAGSTDPRAFLTSASQHLDAAGSDGRGSIAEGGAAVDAALSECRRALDLESNFGPAYIVFGRALTQAKTVSESDLATLNAGLDIPNAENAVRFYRALIYGRLGRTDAALADLKLISDSTTAPAEIREHARTARESIFFAATVEKVKLAIGRSDFNGALLLLDTASRQASPDAAQRLYQPLRRRIEEQAALARLASLTVPNRWPEFQVAARKFLEDFSDSSFATQVRSALAAGPSSPDQSAGPAKSP